MIMSYCNIDNSLHLVVVIASKYYYLRGYYYDPKIYLL